MMIRQTCVYILMASGIFLMAGCSYLAGEPKEGVQADNTLERQPKNLAGSYGDIGSNGSIKPNPESSYKMRRETQGRTNNDVIILGGPVPIPDLRTGNTTTQGSPGGTTPRSGSVSDSGSFSGTRGAGK